MLKGMILSVIISQSLTSSEDCGVMPQIPLPTTIKGNEFLPRQVEFNVNLFATHNGMLLPSAGVESLATGTGISRGAVTFKDKAYQVSGNSLIRINSDGTTLVIGTIAGNAECKFAQSFVALQIVVMGGKGYSMDADEVLVEITDPNYRTSIDVAAINQRFVYVPSDGSVLFYTDVNSPVTINPLNFFDAELLPDRNVGIINLRNDLYVLGIESTEVFRDVGDLENPFRRADGAAAEVGYLAAHARYKDTFVFLGRNREGSYSFMGMSGGSAVKLSTPAIDEILNREYSLLDLQRCTSQRYTWAGLDFVTFRLEDHSFTYCETGWNYTQSGIDPLGQVSNWDVNHMSFAYGKYITGSGVSNEIGILSNVDTEFGRDIERVIQTFIHAPSDTYFVGDNIYLSCLTGEKSPAGTIAVQVSKDNLTYGNQVFRSLGEIGHTEIQVKWLSGFGVYERFCGLRIRTTADVSFSVDALSVNV